MDDKNPKDGNGWTPLHSAAKGGHLEVCKFILENVEDKNLKKDDGGTPLHSVAQDGALWALFQ